MLSRISYQQLREDGAQYLVNVAEAGRYAYRSALKRFREHIGASSDDRIDKRIRDRNRAAIEMVVRDMGTPEKYISSKCSMLVAWGDAHALLRILGDPEDDLGAKIRAVMTFRGLSGRALAAAVGVSEGAVRRWIHGDGWRALTPGRLYAIETALELPASSLGGVEPRKKASGKAVESHDTADATPSDRPKNGTSRRADCAPTKQAQRASASGEFEARNLDYILHWSDWPARLQEEWRALETYKRPAPHAGFQGENDGGWRAENSVSFYLGLMESFAGFALQPVEEAEGLGLSRDDLTLGLLLDPVVVQRWSVFMARQTGQYSIGGVHRVEFVRMLLLEKTGWLWKTPSFAERLGSERLRLIASALEVKLGDDGLTVPAWRSLCDASRARLKELSASIRARARFARDPKNLIQGVLVEPRPLHVMERMHEAAKQDLTRLRGKRYLAAFARYITSRVLLEDVLRVGQLSETTYREDGGGHLRKNENGEWILRARVDEYKNRRSKLFANAIDGGVDYPAFPPDLQVEIDHYIADVRPALLGDESHDRLFVTMRGTPASDNCIHRWIREITGTYLAEESDRGLQVPGVKPFGPHAYRTIVMSDFGALGDLAAGAVLLMDDIRTVTRIYDRSNPSARLLSAKKRQRDS